MAHTLLILGTSGTLDDYLLPEKRSSIGYMDSKGVWRSDATGAVAFGLLWIDRSLLDAVRPFGWRLLYYQRGNAMVQVGRTEDVARQFMENTDERD